MGVNLIKNCEWLDWNELFTTNQFETNWEGKYSSMPKPLLMWPVYRFCSRKMYNIVAFVFFNGRFMLVLYHIRFCNRISSPNNKCILFLFQFYDFLFQKVLYARLGVLKSIWIRYLSRTCVFESAYPTSRNYTRL